MKPADFMTFDTKLTDLTKEQLICLVNDKDVYIRLLKESIYNNMNEIDLLERKLEYAYEELDNRPV